jgi:hypothetical protein
MGAPSSLHMDISSIDLPSGRDVPDSVLSFSSGTKSSGKANHNLGRSLRELNNLRDGRPALHADWRHPSDFTTRLVEAGFRANIADGRVGRGTRLPPQFGQMPCSRFSAQVAQNVHS